MENMMEDDELDMLNGEQLFTKTGFNSKFKHANVSCNLINSLFCEVKHYSIASESPKLVFGWKEKENVFMLNKEISDVGKATPHHDGLCKSSNTGYEGKVGYVLDEWGDNDVSAKSSNDIIIE